MRKYLLLLAAAGLLAAPKMAHAYTATTVATVVNGDTNGNSQADPGETFTITNQHFATFLPTAPGDPTITGGDLANYGFDMNGTVQTVVGNTVHYTGTYDIYYSVTPPFNSHDYSVSAGTFAFDLAFTGFTGELSNGSLTETSGPSNPAFADLGPTVSILDGPVSFYTPNLTNLGATGTLTATLVRGGSTAVPEPGTFALLGTGLLPLLGLRRRK